MLNKFTSLAGIFALMTVLSLRDGEEWKEEVKWDRKEGGVGKEILILSSDRGL